MAQQEQDALNKGTQGTKAAGGGAAKGTAAAGSSAAKKLGKKAAKAAGKAASAAASPHTFLSKVGIGIGVTLLIIIVIIVAGVTGPGMSKTVYLTANNETEMNEPKEDEQEDAIDEKSVATDETAELIEIIQEAKLDEKEAQMKILRKTASEYNCDPDLTEQHLVDETGTSLADDVSAESVSTSEAKTTVWRFLKANGYSDVAAAGIMGNIQVESGFKASVNEYGKGSSGGYGLCQWTGSRRTALKNYAESKGKSMSSIEIQLDFLLHELKTSYTSLYSSSFKKSTDVKYTTREFLEKFEKPAEIENNYIKRLGYAKGILSTYKGMDSSGEVKEASSKSSTSSSSSTASSSESAFFDALDSLAGRITKNKFSYDSNTSYTTYQKSLKGKKKVDCKSYVSWALQEANLVPKGTLFWCKNDGTIHGKSKSVLKDSDNFYTRERVNKRLDTLVKNGDIKKGDIIGAGSGESHHTMVYRGKINGKYTFYSVGGSVNKHDKSIVTNNHRSGGYIVGCIIRPKKAGTFSSEDSSDEGLTASAATRSDFDILAAYSVSVGNGELELTNEESSKEESDGESEDDETYTDITGKKIPLYWWGEKRGLPNYKKDLKKKLKKNNTAFYKIVYATDEDGNLDYGTATVDGKQVKYLKATLKERDVTKASSSDKSAGIKSIAESAFGVDPSETYVDSGSDNATAIKNIGESSYQLLGDGEASSSASVVYGSGQFAMPLGSKSYTLTSKFGEKRSYESHPGCDMAAAQGTPIYAAASGTVTLASYYGGYGYCVIINHGGGLQTIYGHQPSIGSSGVVVKKGQHVVKGQLIGHVGSTGWSTGPHLHFEVRKNGTAVDPSPYLGKKVS